MGLGQQRLPHVVGDTGLPRCPDCREAVEKDHVGRDSLVPEQRPQQGQRLGKAAALDQRLRFGLGGLAGRGGRISSGSGRRRFLLRAPSRRGEHETGGDRKRAEEKAGRGRRLTEERADIQIHASEWC